MPYLNNLQLQSTLLISSNLSPTKNNMGNNLRNLNTILHKSGKLL